MVQTISVLNRRILMLLFLSTAALAHDNDSDEHQDTTESIQVATQNQREEESMHSEHHVTGTAELSDFPNLHPLVVHIPIMLLVFAAVLQLISFFVFREALSWIVMGAVLVGFVGAYAAAVWTHPHVSDLTEQARKVYETHDTYAQWTLWLSGIATVMKGLSHFVFHRKTWAEVGVALTLLATAYTVSMAGHHGAQLVFIEGVGPQGHYLESEKEHSH